MLKLFRDNLRHLSWVLWGVILVFILLIFVDVGAFQPKDAEGGPNAPAAWAGDIVVRFSEYESAYRRLESYQRQLFQGNIPDAFQEQLKVQALQDAFDFKLMLAEAKDMGLKISNSELRKSILEIPAFLDEAMVGFLMCILGIYLVLGWIFGSWTLPRGANARLVAAIGIAMSAPPGGPPQRPRIGCSHSTGPVQAWRMM